MIESIRRVPLNPGSAVLPNIQRVTLPLNSPLRAVNVWILGSKDDFVIVDGGTGEPAQRALWQDAVEALDLKAGAGRHVVTHHHSDHFGASAWLSDILDLEVFMPAREIEFANKLLMLSRQELLSSLMKDHAAHGGYENKDYGIRAGNFTRFVTAMPKRITPLNAGAEIKVDSQCWQIITGGGHSVEMMGLYDPGSNVFIAADHVLPKITPHVAVQVCRTDVNPLGDFLSSLDSFRLLPDDVVVLPSHGEPFCGLHARIDALHGHHKARLERCMQALADAQMPLAPYQVAGAMFDRDLDAVQWALATNEAWAHLRYLEQEGRAYGDDLNGAVRYRLNI